MRIRSTFIGAVPKAGTKGGGVPRVTYEDIGGLKNEVQKVREMIELPLDILRYLRELELKLQRAYYSLVHLAQEKLYWQRLSLAKQTQIFILSVDRR